MGCHQPPLLFSKVHSSAVPRVGQDQQTNLQAALGQVMVTVTLSLRAGDQLPVQRMYPPPSNPQAAGQ